MCDHTPLLSLVLLKSSCLGWWTEMSTWHAWKNQSGVKKTKWQMLVLWWLEAKAPQWTGVKGRGGSLGPRDHWEAFAWRASGMLQPRRLLKRQICWSILGDRSRRTSQLYTAETETPSYKIGNKLSGKVCLAMIFPTLLFLEIHS